MEQNLSIGQVTNNNNNMEDGKNNNNNSSSNYMCRQSSTRWTPTSDQIRILRELYYNNGVRSPTAEQIQRISAKLRQYGKIEGKNVFYWFQNHKARERQKKRLIAAANNNTSDHNNTTNIPMQIQRGVWRSVDDSIKYNNTLNPGVHCPSASTHGVLQVGQNGNYGYGALAMEKSFRECSISPPGNNNHQNFAWVGVDHHHHHPYNYTSSTTAVTTYPFLEKNYTHFEHETLVAEEQMQMEEEEDDEEIKCYNYQRTTSSPIETLPLFPMHEENMISNFCNNIKNNNNHDHHSSYTEWYRTTTSSDHHNNLAAAARASLELSLNSFPFN